MREIRSYGSVRGVAGNRHPYRDWSKWLVCQVAAEPDWADARPAWRQDADSKSFV